MLPIFRDAMATYCSYQRALGLDHKNPRAQELKNPNVIIDYEKIAETDFEKRDFWKVVVSMNCALELAAVCHRFRSPEQNV